MAANKPKYRNIYRLLVATFVLVSLYFFFFSHYGFFLFRADSEDFKIWYPNHHKTIYVFVKAFHIGTGIALLYLIISFWRSADFLKLIKNGIVFINSERNALTSGNTENKYSCKYTTQFWVAQVMFLSSTLIVYFLIRYLAEPVQASVYQLYLSRAYILIAINGFVLFAWINRHYFVAVIVRFLFSPESPYNLAVYRILFFLLLGKEYLNFLQDKLIFIESKPREALPFIGWLIDIMPISKDLYFYICIAGIVTCFFLVFGLFTRFFLFVNAVLVFYIISVPNFYGKLWHSQLPIWISWFLVFAPVADVFSLDRLFFKRKENLARSPEYNFPIKMIWLQIGFIYFWSGFHKLSDAGFDWALNQSMINQVRLEWFEHFDKLPFYRIDLHPWMLYAGGMLTIFFELGFWVFLFNSRTRYISIIGGLIMHSTIKMFMYINFQALFKHYIVFLNFEKVLLAIKKVLPIIPVREMINEIRPAVSKSLIVFSFFIFGMNLICGMFEISSFPFSVYPTYSETVAPEKEFLHYTIADPGKENVDVWELGKKSGFYWENFTRLEYAIIKKYNETSKVDTLAIDNQWKWWTTQLPELKDINTVDVYIYKRSLNPDSASIILKKKYLLTLSPNKIIRAESGNE